MTTRTISKHLRNAGLVIAVAVGPLALAAPATASGSDLAAASGSTGEAYFLPGVSCASSTFCMAAGSFGGGVPQGTVAQVWNGSTWSVLDSPNPAPAVYTGVSCVSSTSCMAVGSANGEPLAENWDGSSLAIQSTPSTTGGYSGVSCLAAPSFCMAVGSTSSFGEPIAATFDGSSWTEQTPPALGGTGLHYLSTVSCTSETFCMAAGGTDNDTLAEMWNGSDWTIETTPDPGGTSGNEFIDISCLSASWCMATLFGGYTESFDGTTWSLESAAVPAGGSAVSVNGISCLSETECTGTGGYTNSAGKSSTLAEIWNGTAWSVVTTPNPTGFGGIGLSGLSCTGTGWCMSVGQFRVTSKSGYDGMSESETGGSWTLLQNPPMLPVSVNPESGPPKQKIAVTGFGFPPDSLVKVLLPDDVKICSTDANADGGFSCSGHIPAGKATKGEHSVEATGNHGLHWSTTYTVT